MSGPGGSATWEAHVSQYLLPSTVKWPATIAVIVSYEDSSETKMDAKAKCDQVQRVAPCSGDPEANSCDQFAGWTSAYRCLHTRSAMKVFNLLLTSGDSVL